MLRSDQQVQEKPSVNDELENVKRLRDQARTSLQALVEASDKFRSHARRTGQDHSVVVFAQEHARFGRAALQGLRRTRVADRLLERADREREDRELRKKEDAARIDVRKHQRLVTQLLEPSENVLGELFGPSDDEESL